MQGLCTSTLVVLNAMHKINDHIGILHEIGAQSKENSIIFHLPLAEHM